jgi:hypothetical protein
MAGTASRGGCRAIHLLFLAFHGDLLERHKRFSIQLTSVRGCPNPYCSSKLNRGAGKPSPIWPPPKQSPMTMTYQSVAAVVASSTNSSLYKIALPPSPSGFKPKIIQKPPRTRVKSGILPQEVLASIALQVEALRTALPKPSLLK